MNLPKQSTHHLSGDTLAAKTPKSNENNGIKPSIVGLLELPLMLLSLLGR